MRGRVLGPAGAPARPGCIPARRRGEKANRARRDAPGRSGHPRWRPQDEHAPVVGAAAILAVLWLVSLWLYRQRIFLRI